MEARQENATTEMCVEEEAVPGHKVILSVKALKTTRIPGCNCQLVRVNASMSAEVHKEDMLFSVPQSL